MQETKGNLFDQWRSGQLASTPGIATAVLTIALMATLFGAQMIIWSRGPAYQVSDQARQRGEEMIQKIAAEGLDRRLGRNPIVRYMSWKIANHPIGYGALYFQPILDGQNITFVGRDIYVFPEQKIRSESEFIMTNDLSKYEYTLYRFENNQLSLKITIRYQNGKLYLLYNKKQAESLPMDQILDRKNLIPPMLLDFFSSVAAAELPDEETAFVFPDLNVPRSAQVPILFHECAVKGSDQIPENITRTPSGHGASVVITDQMEQTRKQRIYYDDNHQIVWQQEPELDETLMSVDQDQLNDLFPDAAQLLDKWLRIHLYEKMDLL